MNKNHMTVVANMFGVDLDEEFIIDGCEFNPYKITEDGLVDKDNEAPSDRLLVDLLYGRKKITRFPWKPNWRDKYWTYACTDWSINYIFWDDDAIDNIRFKAGCVFRTREEAEAARPQKYEELMGKKWSENNG